MATPAACPPARCSFRARQEYRIHCAASQARVQTSMACCQSWRPTPGLRHIRSRQPKWCRHAVAEERRLFWIWSHLRAGQHDFSYSETQRSFLYHNLQWPQGQAMQFARIGKHRHPVIRKMKQHEYDGLVVLLMKNPVFSEIQSERQSIAVSI